MNSDTPRTDRDIFDINCVLLAVQNWDISTGRARECIRDWLEGREFELPPMRDEICTDAQEPRDIVNALKAKVAEFMAGLTCELAAEREQLAEWMILNGFATGHGDTHADLLAELTWQVKELREEK